MAKEERVCPDCGDAFVREAWYLRRREREGKFIGCETCSRSRAQKARIWTPEERARRAEIGRQVMTRLHAERTPEERVALARKAGRGNRHNNGLSVQRQWESIRSDPEQYRAACARLQRTAQNFWDSLTPEERDAHFRKVFANSSRGRSTVGDRFIDRLLAEGIPVKAEESIQGFIVDALVEGTNVIVEFYGDIYHCHPGQFSDPDKYCPWLGRTVGQQWARDRKRLGVFYRYGYKVIIVWETDWYADPDQQVRRVQDAVHQGRTHRA